MGCGLGVVFIASIWLQYSDFSSLVTLFNTPLWSVCMVVVVYRLQVSFQIVCIPSCFLFVCFQEEQRRQASVPCCPKTGSSTVLDPSKWFPSHVVTKHT